MTRYAGFEGILPIREHTQNSLIESSKTSLRISAIKMENAIVQLMIVI